MRPVESHITGILKDIVVWVTHDGDVTIPWVALGAEILQSMFRMCRVATYSRFNLFVHNDIDLDSCLRPSLENLIKTPFLIEIRRSSEKQFRAQPPVCYVYRFFGGLEGDADGPEVVAAIDIPFDLVTLSLGGKRFEAVGFGDSCTLVVGGFLVLFVMAMIGVEDVSELANFVLEVVGADFGIIEMCA